MSGAVNTAANAFMAIPNAAISFTKSAIAGDDLADMTKKTIRGSINPVLSSKSYGPLGLKEKEGAKYGGIFGESAPLPTVVVENPADVARKAEVEKARAKRKAEQDILTGQPGRGGTILTDSYKYQV